MKNLFLTEFYPPPMEGGSLVFLYHLVSRMRRGSVSVLTIRRFDSHAFDKAQPYPIYRSAILWPGLPRGYALREMAALIRDTGETIRRERPDLIHCGHFTGPTGGACLALHARWGLPYILYAYGEELNKQIHMEAHGKGAVMGRFMRALVRHAIGYVVVSDYTADLLVKFGASRSAMAKIVPMVAPQPEPDPFRLSALRERLGLCDGEKVVLHVSRLVPRKGQDNLIRALPEVLRYLPETRLVIAGRGEDEQRLREIVRDLALERAVIFTGFVEEEDLPSLFSACDVFAMPHRELDDGDTEGCPTVFLEANARGKPTVGGAVGGVRDGVIDGKTGLIVDGEDVGQIAAALRRLLIDSEYARALGESGRKRVTEELTPARGALALEEFCMGIMSGRLKA